MIYSVGNPRDPRPDDPRFADRVEAESYARARSFPNMVLAVWEGDDLIALAFDGLVYWP